MTLAYRNLAKIVQSKDSLILKNEQVLKASLNILHIENSAEIAFYQNKISLAQKQRNLERQELLPDININYFQGTNAGLNSNLYGYQLGLKIPILFGGKSSRIKSASIAMKIAEEEAKDYKIRLKSKYDALNALKRQLSNSLDYYEQEGAALSEELLKTANGSFINGEIDFYQFILSLESAYDIKLNYLNKLNQYNNTVIEINYLTL